MKKRIIIRAMTKQSYESKAIPKNSSQISEQAEKAWVSRAEMSKNY